MHTHTHGYVEVHVAAAIVKAASCGLTNICGDVYQEMRGQLGC